jgi:hypothetical protein
MIRLNHRVTNHFSSFLSQEQTHERLLTFLSGLYLPPLLV